MDTQTILFVILFAFVGFCIIYNVIVHGAWHYYHKIDEQILDLRGEEVEATFKRSEEDPNKKDCYLVTMEYTDSLGSVQLARLASYDVIREDELKYLKNQPVRALAYKDLIEVDLSEVSTSETVSVIGIFGVLKHFVPIFSKRCGFPPRHPRKQMLKEIKNNEQ